MRIQQIPAATRGFDCNVPVSAVDAAAFFADGYRFVVRYVPRITASAFDLTAGEVRRLLDAGLAVMPVQHVESESSWLPTRAKGESYGRAAAAYCRTIGVPSVTNCWLDLEGVAVDALPAAVLAYANAWYHAVDDAGLTPGLYVGWHCGLTPTGLYRNLPFKHYWGAYNLNRDEEPLVRGIQMKQGIATKAAPSGVRFGFDTDIVLPDSLGGLPWALAPDEWAV